MNIPYDEMPEKIEELMIEVERLESENKHLLDLQKSMDQQYEELEKENKRIKLTNQAMLGCLKIDKEKIDYYVDRCEQLELVLDEIREVLNNQMDYREFVDMINAIDEILDKVEE